MDKYERALRDLEVGIPGGNAKAVAEECIKYRIAVKPTITLKEKGRCTFGNCKCGMPVNSDMKFCDECGQKLDWKE